MIHELGPGGEGAEWMVCPPLCLPIEWNGTLATYPEFTMSMACSEGGRGGEQTATFTNLIVQNNIVNWHIVYSSSPPCSSCAFQCTIITIITAAVVVLRRHMLPQLSQLANGRQVHLLLLSLPLAPGQIPSSIPIIAFILLVLLSICVQNQMMV